FSSCSFEVVKCYCNMSYQSPFKLRFDMKIYNLLLPPLVAYVIVPICSQNKIFLVYAAIGINMMVKIVDAIFCLRSNPLFYLWLVFQENDT
ncbi:MAG: hypothetical protein ACR2IS_14025, partial [Nitrososphaeraceae archaeon]